FLFAGKYFNRLWPGTAWRYPHSGHPLVLDKQTVPFPEHWHGFPVAFAQRGVSGVYYDDVSETLHVFSGNEFIVINMSKKKDFTASKSKKIAKVYKKL